MHFFAFLTLLLGYLSINPFVLATDNGKTTDVTWDKYSLSVKGERVFVFSGEFHYQRLPVPELWLDVFQKLRANGFNAVSSKSYLICPRTCSTTDIFAQFTFSGASTRPPRIPLTLNRVLTTSNAYSTTPNKQVST